MNPGQPFSQNSTKYLAVMDFNKNVDIVSYCTDRYGRTLGVVYAGGKNVNLEMVKAGLAEVYRGKPAKGFDNGPYFNSNGISAAFIKAFCDGSIGIVNERVVSFIIN